MIEALRSTVTRFGAICILVLSLGDSPARSAPIQPKFMLFGESARATVSEPLLDAVVRSRAVSVDVKNLTAIANGQAMLLNLFDDVQLDAVIDASFTDTAGRRHWSGRIVDHPNSSVLLVLNQGAVAGIIRAPGIGDYRIRSSNLRGQAVDEVDGTSFPPCGIRETEVIHAAGEPRAGGGVAGAPDCTLTMGIMVVYTAEARDIEGGTAAIEALAALAIDVTNQCYSNSAITPRVTLVYTGLVDYMESGSFFTDLARLQGTDDGFMDDVHALRDSAGADLVDLLISNTQGGTICGIGYLMSPPDPAFEQYGFSVCNSGCAGGTYTLPHELGHNQGCHHDRDNADGQGAFDYSYGWRFNGSDGVQYRSVMSYAPGVRIPYFSNPDISYLGTPTGIAPGQPNSADNAQTINLTAPIVAAFRNSTGSAGGTWDAPVLLTNSPALLPGDRAGVSVAIDHELAIVGAYTDDTITTDTGAAYIYRLDIASGTWIQEAKLTAPDASAGDHFGISVDISDDPGSGVEVAIIGANLDDDGGRDSGSAYVYRHVAGAWVNDGKLKSQDLQGGDSFGYSVAITRAAGSDLALIGVYLDDDNGASSGSAYVFRKTTGAWVQEAKIKPLDPVQGNDQFGIAVALAVQPVSNEEFALVGAHRDDDIAVDAGSAYLFKKTGSSWGLVTKLLASDAFTGNQFGYSVAMSFTNVSRDVVVGSRKADAPLLDSGAAYVFHEGPTGWVQQAELLASDAAANAEFGQSVAISGDQVAVGAYLHDKDAGMLNSGAAYFFRRNAGVWTQDPIVQAGDAAADDQFGWSIALFGNRAIIGSFGNDNPGLDTGSAYATSALTVADCNNNGVADECDISLGTSLDANGNGIPDECEVPSGCVGDIVANGVVNIDDLLAVINSWGPCPGCPADIAPPGPPPGNNVVNIDDLLAVINAWGACP